MKHMIYNRLLALIALTLMTLGMAAQDKMAFVIEGPEDMYNQIRVRNETSIQAFRCRVVVLGEDDQILSESGLYNFDSGKAEDSNTDRIRRGTKLGIQLPQDMNAELSYTVEYKDYPFFDAIIIHLFDKTNGFSSEF